MRSAFGHGLDDPKSLADHFEITTAPSFGHENIGPSTGGVKKAPLFLVTAFRHRRVLGSFRSSFCDAKQRVRSTGTYYREPARIWSTKNHHRIKIKASADFFSFHDLRGCFFFGRNEVLRVLGEPCTA